MTEDRGKGCAECTPSGSGNCTFGCFAEPGARPYDKEPTAENLAALDSLIGAATRQVAAMSKARIRYLAAILADTRPDGDGVEGEWAIRLWEAGVRPPTPTPRGFTDWGEE